MVLQRDMTTWSTIEAATISAQNLPKVTEVESLNMTIICAQVDQFTIQFGNIGPLLVVLQRDMTTLEKTPS